MKRYKKNIKALKEKELKKEKAEIEAMKTKRKKRNKQLKIMEKDLPRIQAENEKALRDIRELQGRINNRKTSCSVDTIEKMHAIENFDQKIVEHLTKKKELNDVASKLKDDIAALRESTAQEISLIKNSKNEIEKATIDIEKKLAKSLKKGKTIEANIEKTKLEIHTREIDNEIMERGVTITENFKKHENDYREKTFYPPYGGWDDSECTDWSIVDDLS